MSEKKRDANICKEIRQGCRSFRGRACRLGQRLWWKESQNCPTTHQLNSESSSGALSRLLCMQHGILCCKTSIKLAGQLALSSCLVSHTLPACDISSGVSRMPGLLVGKLPHIFVALGAPHNLWGKFNSRFRPPTSRKTKQEDRPLYSINLTAWQVYNHKEDEGKERNTHTHTRERGGGGWP